MPKWVHRMREFGLRGFSWFPDDLEKILNQLFEWNDGTGYTPEGWSQWLERLSLMCESVVSFDEDPGIAAQALRPKPGVSKILANHARELSRIVDALMAAAVPCLQEPHRTYIPAMRGLKTLYKDTSRITEDIYEDTIRTLHPELGATVEVFTGRKMYASIRQDSNGSPGERANFRKYQEFLRDTFFPGAKLELWAQVANGDRALHVTLQVDGKDHPIHDYGDGVQAVALLSYRLFNVPQNSWVAIEEPETHLHPALQRRFVHTLLSNPVFKEKNLTILIVSHSANFIDVSIEGIESSRVLLLSKSPTDDVAILQPTHERSLAIRDKLGISNGAVLMSQCVVWVEGPSDRVYADAYLRSYCKEHSIVLPRLDIDYTFFEYAGSNLAHYLFEDDAVTEEKIAALFVSNRIFLLADQDAGKEQKHARLRACQTSRFTYHVPEVLEVENTISGSQWPLLLTHLFPKKAAEISAKNFNTPDTTHIRIGKFLQGKKLTFFHKSHSTESGVLSSSFKKRLASGLAAIATWDNMSDSARSMGEALHSFIETHRPAL